MSEWNTEPLAALASFQKGRKVDTSAYPRQGYDAYLGASALEGAIDGYASKSLAVLADPSDVLMLWDGERSGLVGHGLSGVVSSTVSRITPKPKILGTYLYYYLASRFEWIQGRRTGTGVPHVPKDLARILKVDYPVDPKEQDGINKVLRAVDSAIQRTDSLITKYQQIKAGLMHDLFTRGVTADGKLRQPRERAPELYQETPMGWIPNEWDLSGLKAKAMQGIPHLRTGPFGSALKGEHWVEEGHPVITIGALGEGEFIEEELLYVGAFDAMRLKEFQLRTGDVVFSRVADVGRSVVIRDAQSGWIMSSNLMRISLDRSRVIPDILQQQLSYDDRVRRQIRAKVNSGGRDVANSEILNQLQFVWPPYQEQERMVCMAAAIDSRLHAEQARKAKLEQQKKGLMHDLLTGQVSVKLEEESKEAANV